MPLRESRKKKIEEAGRSRNEESELEAMLKLSKNDEGKSMALFPSDAPGGARSRKGKTTSRRERMTARQKASGKQTWKRSEPAGRTGSRPFRAAKEGKQQIAYEKGGEGGGGEGIRETLIRKKRKPPGQPASCHVKKKSDHYQEREEDGRRVKRVRREHHGQGSMTCVTSLDLKQKEGGARTPGKRREDLKRKIQKVIMKTKKRFLFKWKRNLERSRMTGWGDR